MSINPKTVSVYSVASCFTTQLNGVSYVFFIYFFFVTEGTRTVALDVLKILVQYSPTPISDALIETAFPAACHCILNSEDQGTLQSGGELVRTYLTVATQQVIAHRDGEGRTGLQYILQVIGQLLDPQVTTRQCQYVTNSPKKLNVIA